MFQLDYKSGMPICDQVVNGFIRLKAVGVLSAGDQLPSVRTLASQLAVNPNTVQKAYAILEANGIIYSVKGKGSFISDDEQAHSAIFKNARTRFGTAVIAAKELGLQRDDLVEIVDKTYEKGDDTHR